MSDGSERMTRGAAQPGVAGTAAPRVARPATAGRRRSAFRLVAAVTALWVLAMAVFALTEVVLMWLPEDRLLAVVGADGMVAQLEAHRGHFNTAGINAWALVLAVLVQLRRPERAVAPMLQAVGIVLAGTVLYGLSGTFADWLAEEVVLLVLVVCTALLHPRASDLLRVPDLDRPMAVLVAVAAGPWALSMVGHALLQWRDAAGDPHAALEHWAHVALLTVVVVWSGLLGASDHAGWRLPAAIAVVASIDYGVFSLAFPGTASAADPVLAAGAVTWGVAYAVLTWRRVRQAAPDAGHRDHAVVATTAR